MKIKRYAIYHARWQLSTVVMAVPITLLERHFPVYVALALAQFLGACVFWFVDSWIFDD